MFLDRSTLHTSLMGLVGFHQATEPSLPNLLPSLTTSRSGTYYNDAHYLLSHDNIYNSIKNFGAYAYPSYSGATDTAGGYTAGSKIAYTDGNNYEYIGASASAGNAPPNATYWREIDEYNDFLIKAVYNGIDRMLDSYQNKKKLSGKVKSVFENVLLFNGAASVSDLETNRDKFVGIRLRIKKRELHLITILNKIGHQFNGTISGLTLYLYHSSQQAAVATYSVDHTTAKSFQWTSLTTGNVLRYVDTYDAGGDWFIGYKQSDLEAEGIKAIKKELDWDSMPCDCDDVWMNYYKQYSKYVDIMGFEINESEMTDNKLFDVEKPDYSSIKNYGLNFNLTTKCDLTPFIIQEDIALAEVLKYNVGMVLMEALASNTRGTNQLANQVKVEAGKQLFHHREAWGTIADRAKQANEGMSFDFSGMHNGCMPNDNPRTLRIKSRGV